MIWTTTPWTLPGNRAISFSHKIAYGLYRVTQAPENNWAKVGASYILADKLAEELFKSAKVEGFERLKDIPADVMQGLVCAHPLAKFDAGYDFAVPLLAGDHVTDDAGTGFVHTAPSHGAEDYQAWIAHASSPSKSPRPSTGRRLLPTQCPLFAGLKVLGDRGQEGRQVRSGQQRGRRRRLIEAGALLARGRVEHSSIRTPGAPRRR